MKRKNGAIFIKDIIKAIRKILKFTDGIKCADLLENEMLFDAVIRNLEIIGEAAKKVPKEIKDKNDHVPWKNMIGLLNVVIHEYFGIDHEIIHHIIENHLPETLKKIENILSNLND